MKTKDICFYISFALFSLGIIAGLVLMGFSLHQLLHKKSMWDSTWRGTAGLAQLIAVGGLIQLKIVALCTK